MTSVVDKLKEHAAERPNGVAVHGHRQVLTYRQLLDEANRVAHILQRNRVSVLALAADNSPDWVIVDVAAQIAGTALVPLPLFFSPQQRRHALDDSAADAIVLDSTAARMAADLDTCLLDSVTSGLGIWRLRGVQPRKLPGDTAKISYTSGTSGTPKGVCLTQATLDRVAESLCVATADVAIDVHLCLLPLAILLENVAGVYGPLLRGTTIAIPSVAEVGLGDGTRLDPQRLIACIGAVRPQSMILLPQMLASLVSAIEHGAILPATLRFIAVGGAIVAGSLLERAERLGLPVYEGYGLTECASVVALNTPAARRAGSVGRPLGHIDVRIGNGSEIIVRGAAMAGYLGHEPCTRTDAEIMTGDVGYLDAAGFLHITGRRKNLFITSFGRNVLPDWVEATLTGRGSVAQAALFGEARPWNVAVIVPASRAVSHERLEQEIAATNERLPAYAQIHRWLLADEPFTESNGLLTPNGRNRRGAIWNRYRAQVDACYDESLNIRA